MAERKAKINVLLVIVAAGLFMFGVLNFPTLFIKFVIFAVLALWCLSVAQ